MIHVSDGTSMLKIKQFFKSLIMVIPYITNGRNYISLTLFHKLFFLRWCPIDQILPKMQKIMIYKIKNKEINEGNIKQGYFCDQSVAPQLLLCLCRSVGTMMQQC